MSLKTHNNHNHGHDHISCQTITHTHPDREEHAHHHDGHDHVHEGHCHGHHDHDHDHGHGHHVDDHLHGHGGCDGHSHSGWRAYAPHSHSLHSRVNADKRALIGALIILCLAFGVQLVGALIANSSVLVVESLHSLVDSVTVILSLISIVVASASATAQFTYGYGRSEILSAVISLFALAAICFKLLLRALERIRGLIFSQKVHSEEEHANGQYIVVAEAITLVANVSMALMLSRGNTSESLNIRAVRAHIIADSFENMVVLLAGVFMWVFPKVDWIDPTLTIVVVGLLFTLNWRIARETIEVLMQAAPIGVVDSIAPKISRVKNVINVAKFHVWTLTTGLVVGTMRVTAQQNSKLHDVERIREDITTIMTQGGVDEPCVEVRVDEGSEELDLEQGLGYKYEKQGDEEENHGDKRNQDGAETFQLIDDKGGDTSGQEDIEYGLV